MFNATRLKLTGWYLLIIMVISISFSAVIYQVLTLEVDRLLDRQRNRLEQQFNNPELFPLGMRTGRFAMTLIDPELVTEMKNRLIFNLAFINGLILVGAGGLGYVLAGKTLRPIKIMIDEQNRFIADASHELRTPITSLKTTLEVSLRDDKLSLKEARATLKSNLEDVNRLQTLSNALLELAQYQQQRPTKVREKTALIPVIKDAVKVIKPLAGSKSIRLTTELVEGAVLISVKELADVLIILLDNAIKYSPEKTTIHIKSFKHDGMMQVAIADQGIGISSTDLPHIFDRFYQADTSRCAEITKGYGLGLAIAKQTVERNQGSISVTSVVEKGTTFTLRLRIA